MSRWAGKAGPRRRRRRLDLIESNSATRTARFSCEAQCNEVDSAASAANYVSISAARIAVSTLVMPVGWKPSSAILPMINRRNAS